MPSAKPGRTVPDDVSVIGYDNLGYYQYYQPTDHYSGNTYRSYLRIYG